MAAIEVEGLQRAFDEVLAVQGIDLIVPDGEIYGFLGPNGAGKTTVIRTLLGLIEADSGEARLFGHVLPDARREALRRVGAIVEEPRFHARMTAVENLRIHAAVLEPAASERIPAVLERVGLSGRRDQREEESEEGGAAQQRV